MNNFKDTLNTAVQDSQMLRVQLQGMLDRASKTNPLHPQLVALKDDMTKLSVKLQNIVGEIDGDHADQAAVAPEAKPAEEAEPAQRDLI